MTILIPFIGVLLLVLGADGIIPMNPYIVAAIVVPTLGCAFTAPVYAIKALRDAKKARGNAKGQVGLVVIALLVSLGFLAAGALGIGLIAILAYAFS